MADVLESTGTVLTDFDPFGMAFRRDPDEFHPKLVAASPGFTTLEGVPSAWVASYADCTAVLRDFKNWNSTKPKNLPGMQRIDFFNGQPVMNYSDPPEHLRRRKVVQPAFTPKRVERLIASGDRLVEELLEDLSGRDTFDGVADFGKKFAFAMMLGELLELPREDHSIFLNFIATLPSLDALKPGDPKPAAYLAAWDAGRDYCRSAIERARAGSADSVIGLIASSADSGAISDDEMMAMMVVLMTGGSPTISAATAAVLMNMARSPGLAKRLVAEETLAANVLEESIRLTPPVQLVMRFAGDDAHLAGRKVDKFTPLYVMLSSACHDAAKFPDPFTFNPDRENAKEHIGFGFGMHTCIGAPITRAIVPAMLRKVAARLPDLQIADGADIEFETTPRSRHVSHLPLRRS